MIVAEDARWVLVEQETAATAVTVFALLQEAVPPAAYGSQPMVHYSQILLVPLG